MNTSKLTLSQQCKALSDAAAYNELKANVILAKGKSRLLNKHEREAMQSHLRFASTCRKECKRLQDTRATLVFRKGTGT